MPTILKPLKGKQDVQSLIKRWIIIQKELSRTKFPLRVNLEKHRVEHKLIELLSKGRKREGEVT
jgi:hypothetical protein